MAVAVGRSTRSLDVMKMRGVDSLERVEMIMALEEALDGTVPERISELKRYLVPPFLATCIRGGFSTDVTVFARHRSTVLFASLGAAVFGVGVLNSAGEVRESLHYPTVAMATRAFLGAISEAA